ncbi:oxidoreductase-like domain-containing protein 1 isoform X2 [Eurytemora carolleeae]|uniref:oxidoreductase-like domain-containing protein 1 isoform X2 n=1 Tax=Eurytemora carolleeae TaxID=1294199 RepID=UPI000C76B691|nr:oxidoreductase-like domain-containing protein 1 isoform X2 [Eurytemora carolleeae]|eukprot:XP_023349050.1 oxidoreductase-like domain-containing protein 1 isoform X2 [Eurytemora affinis]
MSVRAHQIHAWWRLNQRLNLVANIFASGFYSTTVTDDKTARAQLEGSKAKNTGVPEVPTTCCMSGCANCVWLNYAEDLARYFENRAEKLNMETLLSEVEEKIQAGSDD